VPEDFLEQSSLEQPAKRGFPLALIAGAMVVGLLVLLAYVVLSRYSAQKAELLEPLPMGEEERAYAERLQFTGLQMSRAENFLGQEITYLFCQVANQGDRTVRQLEITLEFRDRFNQVVLRDVRRVIGPRSSPLLPGAQREIEISWEHIPADWNQQYPSIRVSGLLFD
jgi:hypothetical protein